MIEPLEQQSDKYVVHYSILEADEDGRPPNDPKFNKKNHSVMQAIAKSMDVVCVVGGVFYEVMKKQYIFGEYELTKHACIALYCIRKKIHH